jgi:hypothetical protein
MKDLHEVALPIAQVCLSLLLITFPFEELLHWRDERGCITP